MALKTVRTCLPVLALAFAAGLSAAFAEEPRSPAAETALEQLDIPAPPDLTAIIARDLAAERISEPAIEIALPALPDLTEVVSRDLMMEAAMASRAFARIEPAPPAAPQSASAAIALAVIERVPAAVPEVKLDLPLPEPFVSFERMETQPVQREVAESPAPSSAETPRALAEAVPAPTEQLVQLDIPAPLAVSVVIDVPAKPAPALAAEAGRARLTLDDQRLRALIEPHRTRLRLRPAVIDGFAQYYAAREWQAQWIDAAGKPLATATALVRLLRDAAGDGLDPDRLMRVMPALSGDALPEERQAEFDIAASLAAWLYASDARGGRIDPRSVSAMFTPTLTLPQPVEVLAALDAGDVATVLSAYQPRHAGYRALRAELARLRAEQSATILTGSLSGGGSDQPGGRRAEPFMGDAPLQIGQTDPRVPQMRARLRLAASEDQRYAGDLVEAVKAFQRANNLTPNGRITPRTRAALDDPRLPVTEAEVQPDTEQRVAALITNMERWRWLPPELGKTHIFVNIPEFRMEMQRDGARVFETRVIVGKPETQTPVFSDEMEFLVVNPSWTVPPTIMKKEFLPRLAADPEYAARRGFEVIRRGNSVTVRQPPGERNALGFVKFMFPNDHAVYLHDTPTRHLFGTQVRAYSHGCVRVEGPFRLAGEILGSQGFDEKSLRGMVGRGERTIRLTQRFPVHLAYFTIFADDTGALKTKPDIYGHDARLRRALSL